MAGPTVISKTISDFESDCYDDTGDKFRYAVIVPSSTLDRLETTEEHDYVELRPHGAEAEGQLAQIVSFSDAHDPAEYSTDGVRWACIRSQLQREIGIEPNSDEGTKIDIHERQTDSLDALRVHRVSAWEQLERDITTEGMAGYINAEDMASLDSVEPGDDCELINPETGSRIQVPLQTYRHQNYDRDTIRLNGITRKLLEIDSKDEGDSNTVRLRVPTDDPEESRGLTSAVADWVGRHFVDYSYTQLRVLPGYDRDEGRNVVRMNEDAMEGLGIEEDDRVLIRWKGRVRNVRCQSGWAEDQELEPDEASESSYGETESLSVRIPSTERDNLHISVGDSVQVRRDMSYQAGKQVSLSVFGILGVIVGTNQLISMLFEEVTLVYVLASLLSVLVLSIATIWLILKPVRQKCRSPQ